MHPLRRIAQGHLSRRTHNEVVALPYRVGPVGANYTVPRVFDHLVECDDKEQKECDIWNAPHDRDIAASQP